MFCCWDIDILSFAGVKKSLNLQTSISPQRKMIETCFKNCKAQLIMRNLNFTRLTNFVNARVPGCLLWWIWYSLFTPSEVKIEIIVHYCIMFICSKVNDNHLSCLWVSNMAKSPKQYQYFVNNETRSRSTMTPDQYLEAFDIWPWYSLFFSTVDLCMYCTLSLILNFVLYNEELIYTYQHRLVFQLQFKYSNKAPQV